MKFLDANEELIDQLYEDSDQFFNEIAFFKGDITFLRNIIDNYFRNLSRIKNIRHLRDCVGRFEEIEAFHNSILHELTQHHSRIMYAARQESTVVTRVLLNTHLNFSSKIKQFISSYLFLRAEILSLMDDPLNKNQDLDSKMFSGHLLSPN